MNTLKNIRLSAVSTLLILLSSMTQANFKPEIIDSCTAYQQGTDKSEANACKLYIDGFIDSSLYTKAGKVETTDVTGNQSAQESDFLQRVYSTRISSRLPDKVTHQFCIPQKHNRKLIASSIAKSIDIHQLENTPLRDVIFKALAKNFPCSSLTKTAKLNE